MKAFTVAKVDNIAYDDQLVVLVSDEATIEIHLKVPELFTSLEQLKANGIDGEVLKLHLADSSTEKIDELNAALSKMGDSFTELTKKWEDVSEQLRKSESDFQSQTQLLVQAQNDLVSANEKNAELNAEIEKLKAPAPAVEAAPVQ
jgi:septal ring factor EnvC (AmiA/AmiB activator)